MFPLCPLFLPLTNGDMTFRSHDQLSPGNNFLLKKPKYRQRTQIA